MNTSDVIALFAVAISLGSLVLAVLALRSASRNAHTANLLAAANSEMAILGQINEARTRLDDICQKMQDVRKGRLDSALNADEKRYLNDMKASHADAIEVFLNTYELACDMYRAGKLDKSSFRRFYFNDIRKLFEGGTFNDRLHNPVTSKYKALQAVYNECNDHDRHVR